jgi:hypothetical protein
VNRLILRHGRLVAGAILLVFAWVVANRLAGGPAEIVPLAVAAVVVWPLGVVLFIWSWPRITVGGLKRAILRGALGGGPLPVNTLYAAPHRSSQPAAGGGLLATGTDDLLYIGGWLDVKAGPQVLHVPEMAGRYYSLQFTDPASGANVAYVGKRATGTSAGDFLLRAPGWSESSPDGMASIVLPHGVALVIGRVFADDDDDRPVAHALAEQIRLAPLDDRA